MGAVVMAKPIKSVKVKPSATSKRAKLSAAESRARVQQFDQRKERFIATVRKGKDRSLSA
jgi:hypothetical protein